MREAIRLSSESVANGGGPFGAVVARGSEIIATGANRVTRDNDPTAHAEVEAIREASKVLGSFDLSGCEIYTSCEPCPMCLGAIYWAHLDHIYYGNNRAAAKAVNFDDSFIYGQIAIDPAERSIKAESLLSEEAIEVFKKWQNKEDKIKY